MVVQVDTSPNSRQLYGNTVLQFISKLKTSSLVQKVKVRCIFMIMCDRDGLIKNEMYNSASFKKVS